MWTWVWIVFTLWLTSDLTKCTTCQTSYFQTPPSPNVLKPSSRIDDKNSTSVIFSHWTRTWWWTQNTTILLCFHSHTKHLLLEAASRSVFRFSQWISHSENSQSVSQCACVCVYRLIYVSTTRISIHSVHSQLYMDDQYCPVLPPSSYQQVSSTGETLDNHRHDNLQVSSGWETGCLQRALRKGDNDELCAHHLPYQPCLCLGCQNLWTIKIATFRHKNKVDRSYRNFCELCNFVEPFREYSHNADWQNAHCFSSHLEEFGGNLLKIFAPFGWKQWLEKGQRGNSFHWLVQSDFFFGSQFDDS